jgi:tetratricopeptide (TPR) repeat protein
MDRSVVQTIPIAQDKSSKWSRFHGAVLNMFEKQRYLLVSALYALGVLGGLGYWLLSAKPQSAPPPLLDSHAQHELSSLNIPAVSEAKQELDESSAAASKLIAEGDELLAKGIFGPAAKKYVHAQKTTGVITYELALRMGVCSELDNRPRNASDHYRRAIEIGRTPEQRWLAKSGLSRTLTDLGDTTGALRLLTELFLEATQSERVPIALQTEILFQLATALESQAWPGYEHDLSKPDMVALHTTSPRIEELTELIANLSATPSQEIHPDAWDAPSTVEDQNEVTSPLIKIGILDRATVGLDSIVMDVETQLVPISKLLRSLASECGIELIINPATELSLACQSKAVSVRRVPSSMILDSLLLPQNLLWLQEENTVSVFSPDEDQQLTRRYYLEAADRFFDRFHGLFPSDYRMASALMSQGNLKQLSGDLKATAEFYQRALDAEPNEELLAKLFFNIANVELKFGHVEQSLRYFYRALDQSRDSGLQSAAYWNVGQLFLATRELREAIKATGRSLKLARTDQQKRQAALTMARAYLLSNQPLSANQVLFEHRKSFEGSKLEHTAAFLGSFSRYIGMSDEKNLKAESDRLLAALALMEHREAPTFIDSYVAAHAWRVLGFRGRTISSLSLALQSQDNVFWRRQFQFELASELKLNNQSAEAIAIFETLTQDMEDTIADSSLLSLAELYQQQKKSKECIAICQQLLVRKLEEADIERVLQIMGKSYRQLGEMHSAALCFAGMVPINRGSDAER